MIFDGPGQNATLFRQGIPFRPDWENVLTPVVDFLVARADVDADRIALMGVSQGGYWVPRAVAFEHRIAAAIADPGVVDVSTSMLAQLPRPLVKLLDAGDRAKFDRYMSWALKLSTATRTMIAWRMRPYGVTSPFDFFTAAQEYALTDEQLAGDHLPDARHRPGARAVLARPVRRSMYEALTVSEGRWSPSPRPRAPTGTASRPRPGSAASGCSTGSTSSVP